MLAYRVGETVKAACDIIQEANDYSPEHIVAHKGDKLTIEKISWIDDFDYVVSGYAGNPNFHVKHSELK